MTAPSAMVESDLWENDIAIIKLASPLNLSSYVTRPASNQNDYRDASNTFVTIGHGNGQQKCQHESTLL
ncbi:trypsin-like serine protease [Vibrio sp. PP-XX7]